MARRGMSTMWQVMVLGLLAGSFYLGHGWLGARAENVQLRRTITALKRQLGKQR
jgi:hypothetical protein